MHYDIRSISQALTDKNGWKLTKSPAEFILWYQKNFPNDEITFRRYARRVLTSRTSARLTYGVSRFDFESICARLKVAPSAVILDHSGTWQKVEDDFGRKKNTENMRHAKRSGANQSDPDVDSDAGRQEAGGDNGGAHATGDSDERSCSADGRHGSDEKILEYQYDGRLVFDENMNPLPLGHMKFEPISLEPDYSLIEPKNDMVDARSLHSFLQIRQRFNDWFTYRVKQYDLEHSGTEISVSTAKELCMVENNEMGKKARKYFIECEKRCRQTFKPPQDPLDAIQAMLDAMRTNKAEIGKLNDRVKELEESPVSSEIPDTLYNHEDRITDVEDAALDDSLCRSSREKIYDAMRDRSKKMGCPTYIGCMQGLIKREYLSRQNDVWYHAAEKYAEDILDAVNNWKPTELDLAKAQKWWEKEMEGREEPANRFKSYYIGWLESEMKRWELGNERQ